MALSRKEICPLNFLKVPSASNHDGRRETPSALAGVRMFRCGSLALALWSILATHCSADASHARTLDELHLVSEAPSPQPQPAEVFPDSESRDSIVLVDPEDLELSRNGATVAPYAANPPIPLASPVPQPRTPEELMRAWHAAQHTSVVGRPGQGNEGRSDDEVLKYVSNLVRWHLL